LLDVVGNIASGLSILTVYWVTKKDVRGMYTGLASNAFWVSFGIMGNYWYIIFSNLLFFYFGIRGLKHWKENE